MRWISVTEQLPELEQDVLIYAPESFCKVGVTFLRRFGNEIWWKQLPGRGGSCVKSNEVTHWMPLPDPPLKEQKNGK